MAGYVLFGTLAAFGALSVLWVLFGWLLPGGREGLLILPGRPGETETSFVRRYLWLRGLGLLEMPLVMVDLGLSQTEKNWLADREIELCGPEELSRRLGIGAEAF